MIEAGPHTLGLGKHFTRTPRSGRTDILAINEKPVANYIIIKRPSTIAGTCLPGVTSSCSKSQRNVAWGIIPATLNSYLQPDQH